MGMKNTYSIHMQTFRKNNSFNVIANRTGESQTQYPQRNFCISRCRDRLAGGRGLARKGHYWNISSVSISVCFILNRASERQYEHYISSIYNKITRAKEAGLTSLTHAANSPLRIVWSAVTSVRLPCRRTSADQSKPSTRLWLKHARTRFAASLASSSNLLQSQGISAKTPHICYSL